MPRTARLDLPDLLQHVIVRGVNRGDIFLDDHDRLKFLQRFSKLLIETGTECFAWSLMTNHLHLLLRPRQTLLAPFMRRLLTGYAISFNRRHQRSGHLFQNRYKSIVCEQDAYLLELVRYIHLNPLRAGLVNDVEELDAYPWSGHSVVMHNADLKGQMINEVLGLFSAGREEGRKRYRAFVADGVAMGHRDDLVGIRKKRTVMDSDKEEELFDDRVLGGGEFIQELRARRELEPRLSSAIGIREIIERVCDNFGVDPVEVRKKTRSARIAEVRSVICYLAAREVGHNGVEVGRCVNLGRAGVSHSAARGEGLVRENPILLQLLDY
jgi:putative transposase